MPKSKKVTAPIQTFIKEEQTLLVNKQFVYEVAKYRLTARTYNLEDSKYMQSKEFTKDSQQTVVKDGITFKERVTLVGAPLSWLIENKFIELCQDQDLQRK